MKVKRSFTGTAIRQINEEEMSITHVVNTKTIDRYKTIVLPKGAVVDNFMRNPVVLWLHNVDNNPVKIPIGKCVELDVDEDAIKATTKFNPNDPLAVKVFNAYRDGFLNAWSIGFQPINCVMVTEENREELNVKHNLDITEEQMESAPQGLFIIDEWELHEYSAVPVPANPEALNLQQKQEHCKVLVTRGLTGSTDFSTLEDSLETREEPKTEEKVTEEEPKEVVEEVKEEPKVTEEKENVPEEDKTELEKLEEEKGTTEKEVLKKEEEEPLVLKKETQETPKEEAPNEVESTEEPEVQPEEDNKEVEKVKEDVQEVKEEVKEVKEEIATLLDVIKIIKAQGEELVKQNQELVKQLLEVKKGLEVDNIETIRSLEESREEKRVTILGSLGINK